MTWVPRTPKRPDFCGCPPCPLCFCWSGDNGLIDGMTKFTVDMLGGKTPTANESQVLKDAAESIHVTNLSAAARIDAELKEADRTQHTQREMDAVLAQARVDAARPPPPKKDERPVLDDLDPKVFEKPKPVEINVTFGNSSPLFLFDQLIQKQMMEMFTPVITKEPPASSFCAADFAIPEPPKKDAKEIQADFAREEAKKRMREMARANR